MSYKHTHPPEKDRCGTCAEHRWNDVNTKKCNNSDSPFYGEVIDPAIIGRMDGLKPDIHCGVWTGGKRFAHEVKDTDPFRPS